MSSCKIKQLISISNIQDVKEFLFETNKEKEVSWEEEQWGDWEVEDDAKIEELINEATEEVDNNEHGWIEKCIVSISPLLDHMCIAYQDRIAFLNVKSGNLKSCWKGVLTEEGENVESITEVLCLPLVSLKKSSYGCSDWTCVVVGLASGYIRLYTENGDLLISQAFHESAVLELSCCTLHSTKHQVADQKEEVTLLYKDALVILDGFSLFQTLRACRNKLAAATASGTTQISPPPLSYKKWKLMRQDNITSHVSTGVNVPTPFEQMHSASIHGGFNTEITTNPPAISQYVTCGAGPFVGFYLAIEGSSTPFLSHVALEVANKFKTALYHAASGWLNWGSQGQQPEESNKKQEPKIEAGTPLDMTYGFPDIGRHGNKIKLAPGTNWLAATTDSFGRVLLIDLTKGYVVRMWKGYRDAQVGFIQTTDDTRKQSRGHTKLVALFLCIYAPRRGIVEIWSCINGPRVGAFNISKNARLLSPQFGILGLNNVTEKGGILKNRVQCCIVEADGKIKDILVPFHLTLSDTNSSKARDIHLLRNVNQLIHAKKRDDIEITKLLGEMMMCSVQKQGIEKILQSRRSGRDLCRLCLEQTLEKLNQRGSNKKEELNFVEYLKSQLTLVNLYDSVCEINKQFTNVDNTKLDDTKMCELLNITQDNWDKVKLLFESYKNSHALPNITFQDSVSIEIVNFLPCFKFNENGKCSIIENGTNRSKLGNFLFHSSLFGSINPLDILTEINKHVDVSDKEILKLVFESFQDNENIALKNVSKNVEHLQQFIVALSENKSCYVGDVAQEDAPQGLSHWWEWVRGEVCVPSRNVLTSYVIALTCRGVAVEFNKRESKKEEINKSDDNMEIDEESTSEEISRKDWETLWVDIERWKFVVLQLEDCLLINVAISLGNQCSTMDKMIESVSVLDLQSNGSGYIAELMATTSCRSDVSLHIFNPNEKLENEFTDKQELLKDCIEKDLFERLPISLSANVFHSHCFWEAIVTWNKDCLVVENFEKALSHLSLISCDPHLQHGLAVMAWNMFIKKRFLALVKLIDKVGKSPKDRLCRKEVEISENSMPKFCGNCQKMFQIISNADPDQFPKPSIDTGYEKMYESNLLVEDTWKDVTGKESIVELGKSQATANYLLVQYFLHLLFIVHGIVKFSLSKVKPLTQLFDHDSISYLSMDICDNQQVLNTQDIVENKIMTHRKQFFDKLITAVVSKMGMSTTNEDYYNWILNTIHMAAEFQVDESLVQIQYVDELFRNGLDLLGHEALKSVNDSDLMASRLLVVLGQRLSHYFLNVCPDDGIILMSQMPTTLSSWIKAHDPNQIPKPDVNIEDTIFLTRVVASMLPEDHAQYSIALCLVEIVSSLSN